MFCLCSILKLKYWSHVGFLNFFFCSLVILSWTETVFITSNNSKVGDAKVSWIFVYITVNRLPPEIEQMRLTSMLWNLSAIINSKSKLDKKVLIKSLWNDLTECFNKVQQSVIHILGSLIYRLLNYESSKREAKGAMRTSKMLNRFKISKNFNKFYKQILMIKEESKEREDTASLFLFSTFNCS